MHYRITTFIICCLCFCLTGQSIQAEVYSDSSRIIKLLALAEKEKDHKKAAIYTLQSLSISTRLNNHLLMAKSYRQLSYLYRPERNARLYAMDSLFMYYAGRSGNKDLFFDALQLYAKDYLNNNQVPQAEKYISALDSLAQEADTTFRKCIAAQVKAFYHFKRFRPVESLAQAENGLHYAQLLQNKRLIGRSLCQVGDGYLYRFKHDSAAMYYFKAVEELKKLKEEEELARAYGQLGFLYETTGNSSRSIAYYEMSYTAFEKAGLPLEAAYVPLKMSDVYFNQRKYDTALININKAFNTFRKYNYGQGLGLTYSCLGRYYAKVNQKDSADHYAALSKETLKQYNNSLLSFYATGYETYNAIDTRNFKKADTLIRRMIGQLPSTVPQELLKGAIDIMGADGYSAFSKEKIQKMLITGDTTLLAGDTMINPGTGTLPVFDSLITQQQHRKIAEVEARFKVREAQDSTKLAQKESLLTKQQLTQRNIILIFSFLLLAVSGLLLYFQVKNRKRALADKQRAIEDKATIEHLKDELDHRVGNTLNNISFIISLVKTRTSDKSSFELLEEKVDPLMVLYRMLSENKTEDVALQDYFEKICKGLKASYDHEDKITLYINAPVTMSGSKAGKVGLILNELVTNSFKYAFATQTMGSISVTCSINDDEQYYLSITDSGPGMQQSANHGTQKGLHLVRALAYQLKATIREKQEAGVGFEFFFL